jgi:hypothetical protein
MIEMWLTMSDQVANDSDRRIELVAEYLASHVVSYMKSMAYCKSEKCGVWNAKEFITDAEKW